MKYMPLPKLKFAIFYAFLFTAAMMGWHFLADPTGITGTSYQWMIENVSIVCVWIIINMCQNTTSLTDRAIWGIMFSATVAMIAVTAQTGWQGVLNRLLMKLPIIGDIIKADKIWMSIPKVLEIDIFVLFMGKLSGITPIELPRGQFLPGPIHPFDDVWRNY